MKLIKTLLIVLALWQSPLTTCAQIPLKTEFGMLMMDDHRLGYDPSRYQRSADSLDRVLKVRAKDTTALFYRSALLLMGNQVTVRSAPGPEPLSKLQLAKSLADTAIAHGMKDRRLKVLQAQILKSLCYQYASDESWKYRPAEVVKRKLSFNRYKEQANRLYEELAVRDPNDAYDYRKLKVTAEYPIH